MNARGKANAVRWVEFSVRRAEEELAAATRQWKEFEEEGASAEMPARCNVAELRALAAWQTARRQARARAAARLGRCQSELRRVLALRAALSATRH